MLTIKPFLIMLTISAANAKNDGLFWDSASGVIFRIPEGEAVLGGGTASPILLSIPAEGGDKRLDQPKVVQDADGLRLTYQVTLPAGTLTVTRELKAEAQESGGVAVVEKFRIVSSVPLISDVEVVRPWELKRADASISQLWKSVWPVITGWAYPQTLTSETQKSEFRLGNILTGAETPQLSLPIQEYYGGTMTAALYADPLFGALFEQRSPDDLSASGVIRFRYSSKVPLTDEARTFAVWLRPANPTASVPNEDAATGFPATMDGFFRLMLPDVPAGPKWLHDIAMVSYDYLSDGGKGYENDVRALAAMLTPAERARVLITFHGWFDGLGNYCYDETTGQLKQSWNAFPMTRNVPYTQDEVRRKLQLTKDLGFRVIMYYADGILTDSGQPYYREDRVFKTEDGNCISGWQGPDTVGPTHAQNPAHPDVRAFYLGYLDALIKAYGSLVDGFVLDETFYIRAGMIAKQPSPAYADRAMLTLIDQLRMRVKEQLGSEKVFLSSDALGVFGWRDVPPSALWADGTYQDTHGRPSTWTFGFFPNWRNVLWSCNWNPITDFAWTEWSVRTYQKPVAISNGWGDDRGASEWTGEERDRFLALFRERLKSGPATRWAKTNPAIVLATAPVESGAASLKIGGIADSSSLQIAGIADPLLGDELPVPSPGERNWALASEGSTASASSETNDQYGVWRASGVIDGVRDDTGWTTGHGWVSEGGQPLPQWVEVNFPSEREVSRFVVVTYHKLDSTDTASKWGVTNYRIEAWDAAAGSWKTAVTEIASRTVKTRVHTLKKPLKTTKFRVVALNVAPQDGRARLLQVEAWGSPIPATSTTPSDSR
jgi:hypothetical protein